MSAQTLEARVQCLERQNRRLKRPGFIALTVVGCALSVSLAHQQPQILEAHGFRVVDSNGRSRAPCYSQRRMALCSNVSTPRAFIV
jgi:hypothetical protein